MALKTLQQKHNDIKDLPENRFNMEFASLGSQTGATAPGSLGRVQLQEVVELWSSKYYSEFALLPMFDEDIIDSEEVMWEQITNILAMGSFTSGPDTGKRMDLQAYSKNLQRVIYQSYMFSLNSNQSLLLRDPGMSRDFFSGTARKAAEKKLSDQQRLHSEVYWRTLHFLACQVLQGVTTITSPVSGVTATINTGITVTPAAASWATASTDIITEFNSWVLAFREKNNGLNPTDIVINHRFHQLYILPNTELRGSLAPYNPAVMGGPIDPLLLMAEKQGFRPKIHLMSEMYDQGGSSRGQFSNLAHVWPTNKMSFILNVPGENNLKLLTARTMDNDMMGGVASYTDERKNPKGIDVVVAGNHVPQVENPLRVECFTLVP